MSVLVPADTNGKNVYSNRWKSVKWYMHQTTISAYVGFHGFIRDTKRVESSVFQFYVTYPNTILIWIWNTFWKQRRKTGECCLYINGRKRCTLKVHLPTDGLYSHLIDLLFGFVFHVFQFYRNFNLTNSHPVPFLATT